MSSHMKVSLLALVSTAAAVPHYGQHSRFHHKPSGGFGTGAPYPTGGWGGYNSTGVPQPTGVFPEGEKTTTLVNTEYSTETIVSTIYATRPGGNGAAPSSVGVADASTGAAQCGPETVYVTATNKVTVTVPAGGAGAPPSSVVAPSGGAGAPPASYGAPSSAAQPTSAAPEVPETPASSGAGYSIAVPSGSFVLPSSVGEVQKPTSAAVVDYTSAVETPTPTPQVPASSAAPESSTPVSSKTPTSSGTPTYSGTKRGLAYNSPDLCKAFEGSYGFAYNWGQTQGGDIGGTPYAPMFAGPVKPANTWPAAKDWLANVDTAVKAGSKVVMGFNECDHPDQCATLPGDACAKWTEYMNPIASSHPEVTIVGPSVTNADKDNWGLDWLTKFNTQCTDAVWHATNIHFYDQYGGSDNTLDNVIQRFKSHVETAAKNYGKPVWVTEFGLNKGTADEENTKEFLKQCMDYMDNSKDVAGYSYFMVGTDAMQLNSGTGLSALGNVYASTS